MARNKPFKDHLGNRYMSIADMASAYGIKRTTLNMRLKNGIPLREALQKGDRRVLRRHSYFFKGKFYDNIEELAFRYNIKVKTLRERIRGNDGVLKESMLVPEKADMKSMVCNISAIDKMVYYTKWNK